MEPDDTIEAIRAKDVFTSTDVDCLRALTQQYPDDAYLWDVMGDVSQLVDLSSVGSEFARMCYLQSIRADPKYGPAHTSLGYWYDIDDNLAMAKKHFELAIEHGEGGSARDGLASVVTQMKDRNEEQDL